MIKYYIKGGCTFAFDTVSENIDKLEYVYLSDCWLIEEDGELTIFDRDGFKQRMQVTKGDVIVGAYVDDDLEYITVKDVDLADLMKRAIQSKRKPKEECDNGQTAD